MTRQFESTDEQSHTCSAIWTLLRQHDLASQQQGIALLRALDDPAIWASLADGLSLDGAGRVVMPAPLTRKSTPSAR